MAVAVHSPLVPSSDDRSWSDYSEWATERVVEEVVVDSARFFASKPENLSDWSLLLRPNRRISIHNARYTDPLFPKTLRVAGDCINFNTTVRHRKETGLVLL